MLFGVSDFSRLSRVNYADSVPFRRILVDGETMNDAIRFPETQVYAIVAAISKVFLPLAGHPHGQEFRMYPLGTPIPPHCLPRVSPLPYRVLSHMACKIHPNCAN